MITDYHPIGSGLLVKYDNKDKKLYIYNVTETRCFQMNMDTFNELLKFMECVLEKEEEDGTTISM